MTGEGHSAILYRCCGICASGGGWAPPTFGTRFARMTGWSGNNYTVAETFFNDGVGEIPDQVRGWRRRGILQCYTGTAISRLRRWILASQGWRGEAYHYAEGCRLINLLSAMDTRVSIFHKSDTYELARVGESGNNYMVAETFFNNRVGEIPDQVRGWRGRGILQYYGGNVWKVCGNIFYKIKIE
jgi:hypothetical protein